MVQTRALFHGIESPRSKLWRIFQMQGSERIRRIRSLTPQQAAGNVLAVHFHVRSRSPQNSSTRFETILLSLVLAVLSPVCPLFSGSDDASRFKEEFYLELKGFKGFSIREFNRVDGFAPTFRLGIRGIEEGRYPSLRFSMIYYVEREKPGWEFTIERFVLKPPGLMARFKAFRLTDTNDRWRMSDLENSLSSFLFKEDFRNYYVRNGISLSLSIELNFTHLLYAEFTDQTVRSLRAGDPFTLFGWGKEFRSNPAIEEGSQRSLLFGWNYDSRDNIRFPRRGWFNSFSFETSPSSFSSDFNYHLFSATLRRYNIVFGKHYFNFRISMGLSARDLPAHRHFTIGGVGTLRGYPDLSDGGTNYILGNVEYRFPFRGINWKPFRFVFSELQAVFFLDTGDAWTEEWETSNLKTDIGAGISGANIFSYFGLYVAQALEGDGMDPRVIVKIEREF